MKRLTALILAVVVSSCGVIKHKPNDWTEIAGKVAASTVFLQEGNSIFCSGFAAVGPELALTAAHCVDGSSFSVDGKPAEIINYSEDLDWALVKVSGLDKPMLPIRCTELQVGEYVAAYGSARDKGLYEHFRVGVIAGIGKVDGYPGRWVILDQAVIGGMSGGPIVDRSGRVVGLNQRSDRSLSSIFQPISDWGC